MATGDIPLIESGAFIIPKPDYSNRFGMVLQCHQSIGDLKVYKLEAVLVKTRSRYTVRVKSSKEISLFLWKSTAGKAFRICNYFWRKLPLKSLFRSPFSRYPSISRQLIKFASQCHGFPVILHRAAACVRELKTKWLGSGDACGDPNDTDYQTRRIHECFAFWGAGIGCKKRCNRNFLLLLLLQFVLIIIVPVDRAYQGFFSFWLSLL